MSLFIKLFNTTAEYNTYTADTENFILPNVSCTMDDLGTVHYNPWVETRVVAKFNVTDTSSSTIIANSTRGFSRIEIDGIEQSSVKSRYTFSSVGEHTVKYTLTSQTTIGSSPFSGCTSLTSIIIPNGVIGVGGYDFQNCRSLTSITIPDSVTTIGNTAFAGCTSLTSIDIPSGVTRIYNNAFNGCSNLTSITSNAVIAPTISNYTFYGVSNYGTLTVPNGSSGYDVWMGTGDYYLGKYGWTKVEQ